MKFDLGKGRFALVDKADYENLKQHNWCFEGRYAYRRDKGKKIYLHREIMGFPEKGDIDHINRDKLDNRRANLRLVNRSQNMANAHQKHKNATSKYRGVCWHKQRSKWKAEIKKNGIKKHLGVFIDEIEAARAYNEAAKELHGEFAVLNDI